MSQADADRDFQIPFPLEFVIGQTPVSAQAKRRQAKERWEQTVARHAREKINRAREQYFLDDRPVMATIYYFPSARMAGDIDNIVKPVLDGMIAVAYPDDRHIEKVVVRKFEPGIAWLFASPSVVLSEAIDMEKPCVHIRLEDDLVWRQAS